MGHISIKMITYKNKRLFDKFDKLIKQKSYK